MASTAGDHSAGSTSIASAKTIQGSHEYTIRGYSLCKGIETTSYIVSDTFEVGGYKWHIRFYPQGKKYDLANRVSIFLELAVLPARQHYFIKGFYDLRIIDQTPDGTAHIVSAISPDAPAQYQNGEWGAMEFCSQKCLSEPGNRYVKDDTLVIYCTVGVVNVSVNIPKNIVTHPSLAQDLCAFFDSGVGFDIEFDVSGEILKAHKVILAANSPVLKSMLLQSNNTDNCIIRIQDVQSPTIFKAMLNFMYRDELTESISTVPQLQLLLEAAHRYGLDRLKLVCQSKLCDKVNVDTVLDILVSADQHQADLLKGVCLRFAASPFFLGDLMRRTDGLKSLNESYPHLFSQIYQTAATMDANGNVGARHRR